VCNTAVKSSSVNWLPRSVLKIAGGPFFHGVDAEARVEQIRQPPS
jgi:hypothetical protein